MSASMRPRWAKVLHDLWDNKSRTILAVLSIAVGVFSIGVITGAYVIISSDINTSYAANNPMNIEIRSSPINSAAISMVMNTRGVDEVEGRYVFDMRVSQPGSTQWTSLSMVAIDDFSKVKINLLTSISGSPVPEKKQVVLEKKVLDSLKLKPGDTLEVQLMDGSIKTLTVAGVVQDPSSGAGDFLAQPFSYIDSNTLAYLGFPQIYNRIYATVSEGQNDLTSIRQVGSEIEDKLEKSGFSVFRSQYSITNEHPMASIVSAILGILLALGVLILFLSSSLIANTLNALLTQHTRHIGVMKLVGGQRNQILGMYIALILAFGLISLAISVPLGGQGAYALSVFVADKLNFKLLGYRIVPLSFIIQIIVGLAGPLLAGIIPVLKGSRTTVMHALNGDSTRDEETEINNQAVANKSFSARAAHWLAKRKIHFPRPLLFSLRNTFRRKGRLLLTLFTLTMAGAIFIAVFNLSVTLHDYVEQIGNYFLADVTLDFNQPYRINKIQREALTVPGVVEVEGWTYASADVIQADGTASDNLTILAPPAESKLVTPLLVSGRWLEPGDDKAVTISEGTLSNLPGIEPGDFITLKMNGKKSSWEVVGIFKFVSQSGSIAYANYETISRLNHSINQSFSYRIVTDNHDKDYQAMIAQNLDTHFRDRNYQVADTQTGDTTLKTAVESLDLLITFLLIMAVLTAVVGSIGLTGTMFMNVMERTRETGIMRSIGAVDSIIMRSVITEGVLIGGISWFLGAILSIPITYLLSTIVSLAIFETPIEVHFTSTGFLIWLGVVLVLSAAASILPARNAARLTIREVLAYE
jgi:putative ABC transport system permease protein